MNLGNKYSRITHSLGNKHYKPSQSLGVRFYPNKPMVGNNPLTHTPDGIIYNNSNSGDAHREPMKHQVPYAPKNYTQNIKHSTIEKARKKKPEENHDKHFDK